uniref:Uncharacterized protein n=1 Tax=Aegilops tauschii subsp. strangulata TaxID=200361 RepID=A0A453BKG3_AEGTS
MQKCDSELKIMLLVLVSLPIQFLPIIHQLQRDLSLYLCSLLILNSATAARHQCLLMIS